MKYMVMPRKRPMVKPNAKALTRRTARVPGYPKIARSADT